MYKNFLINYAKNLTKEDLYNFKIKNNINATDNDINIIYEHIKKYNTTFFDNPLNHIEMLNNKISKSCYDEILKYYEKYKSFL